MERLCNEYPLRAVVNKWTRVVHEDRRRDYGDIYDACTKLMSPHLFGRDRDTDNDTAAHFLRSVVLKNVFPYEEPSRRYFLGSTSEEDGHRRPAIFPGPVATRLSKHHLRSLAMPYWLYCQPYRGIRVMFLSLFVGSFPRWEAKLRVADRSRFFKFSLENTCRIETAASHLQGSLATSNSLQIELSDGTLYWVEFQPTDGDSDSYSRPEGTKREGHFTLVVDGGHRAVRNLFSIPGVDDEDGIDDEQPEPVRVELVRKVGRMLSYFLDKDSFLPYMLVEDDYVFPVFRDEKKRQSVYTYQPLVLLDGEIVEVFDEDPQGGRRHLQRPPSAVVAAHEEEDERVPLPPRRRRHLEFLISDVISYGTKDRVISCTGMSMSEKLDVLRNKVLGAYEAFYDISQKDTLPSRIRLRLYEFWDRMKLQELLSNISAKMYRGLYGVESILLVPEGPVAFRNPRSTTTTNSFAWKRAEDDYLRLIARVYPRKPRVQVFRLADDEESDDEKEPELDEDHVWAKLCFSFYKTEVVELFEDAIPLNVSNLSAAEIRTLHAELPRGGVCCECSFKAGEWVVRALVPDEWASRSHNLRGYFERRIENIQPKDILKSFRSIKFYDPLPLKLYRETAKAKNSFLVARLRTDRRPYAHRGQRRGGMEIVLHFAPPEVERLASEPSESPREGANDLNHPQYWKPFVKILHCYGPDFSQGQKLVAFVREYTTQHITGKNIGVRLLLLPSGSYQIIDFVDLGENFLSRCRMVNGLRSLVSMLRIVSEMRGDGRQEKKRSRTPTPPPPAAAAAPASSGSGYGDDGYSPSSKRRRLY